MEPPPTISNNDGIPWRSVLTSILGRVFYSYQNKYLFTATIRRDGSSKFGKNNRYGYFPSFSLGWNVAEEKFMENVHWLDQLKLRGGYGVLGNQEIDNYQYSSTITTGINYPDGNGGLLQGAFPKNFANPEGGRALIKGEIILSMLKLMEVIPPFIINIETINKSNLTHLYIAGKFNY